jgi:hypothetical protein
VSIGGESFASPLQLLVKEKFPSNFSIFSPFGFFFGQFIISISSTDFPFYPLPATSLPQRNGAYPLNHYYDCHPQPPMLAPALTHSQAVSNASPHSHNILQGATHLGTRHIGQQVDGKVGALEQLLPQLAGLAVGVGNDGLRQLRCVFVQVRVCACLHACVSTYVFKKGLQGALPVILEYGTNSR